MRPPNDSVPPLPFKRPSQRASTLLLGFDPRTALAVARSLHRQHIRAVVAMIADWEVALPSRAVAAYVSITHREDPAQFLAELETVLRVENIDTILPMTDRALRSLVPHLSKLAEQYCIGCPSADQLEIILDKAKTCALANSLNVSFPATLSAQALGESGELRAPVFAKLCDKALQDTLTDPCDPAVGLAKNRAELTKLVDTYGEDRLLFQEYIEGDDVGLALLVANGVCLRSFQYRALRLHPASGGVCTLGQTEPVDPALLSTAMTMLSRLQWRGLAQIDFRHNRESGRFALLEINGRFWGSTAIAVRAGADFPLYVYQHLHASLPENQPSYKIGLKARWLEGDVRRLIQYFGFCRSSGMMRKFYPELFNVLKSFDPRVSGMFWSWRDPGPAARSTASIFCYWALSQARRFFSRVEDRRHSSTGSPSLAENPRPPKR